MTELDLSILDWIQAHWQCQFLDTVTPWITKLGDGGVVWILLALVLLAIPRTRHLGIAVTAALLVDLLLCNILIKPLVARTRPFVLRPEIQLLIAPPGDYSFPSGHTAASFAAAGALFFAKNRGWIPALILAIAIGFTRLYLYVHYPTDVLAGAVLGVFCGAMGAWIAKKALDFYKNKRI